MPNGRNLDIPGSSCACLGTFCKHRATVEEFIEWFPGVTREQVNLVLDHAARRLAESFHGSAR